MTPVSTPVPSPDDDVIELRCTRLANGSVRWVGDYDDAVWPGEDPPHVLAVVPADLLAAVTRERDELRASRTPYERMRPGIVAALRTDLDRVTAQRDEAQSRSADYVSGLLRAQEDISGRLARVEALCDGPLNRGERLIPASEVRAALAGDTAETAADHGSRR